jgi:hypothetical protein
MPEGKVGRAVKGCSDIREKLSVMLDGMLPPDEIKAVEEHIAACPSCAAALEDLRKVVGHLQTLEQVEPPPWMTQKVMAKVRSLETAPRKKGFFSWLFQPAGMKVPIGALATLILALTTYFIFEGIISDMPVQKTEQTSETSKQVAVEPTPAPVSEKAVAPTKRSDKTVTSKPATETLPTSKLAQQQKPMDDAGKKDKMENRLWQEEPATSKAEISKPVAPKGGYRHAPPAAAPSPTAAREVERKETGAVSVSKRAKAAGIASQSQYDKAATMPEEASYPKAKSARFFVAEKHPVSFHVVADDPASVAAQIAAAIKEFKGQNIRKDIIGNKTIVRGEISAVWLDRFFDRLKKTGSVLEKNAPAFAHANNVLITVEIVSGN